MKLVCLTGNAPAFSYSQGTRLTFRLQTVLKMVRNIRIALIELSQWVYSPSRLFNGLLTHGALYRICTDTCFVFKTNVSAVGLRRQNWWTVRDSHSSHAACKAVSPLWYMTAHGRALLAISLQLPRNLCSSVGCYPTIFGGASRTPTE